MKLFIAVLLMVSSFAGFAKSVVKPAPSVSIPSQDAFFELIKQHCGKAFNGKIVTDSDPSPSFTNKVLTMHVRKCTDTQLQVPFHVGDDASRTWIITKTGSGLSLKHDHRQHDGEYDPLTMYGGHTFDAGSENLQSFPADEYSKQLFTRLGLQQSNKNTWQMFVYPDKFSYRLIRPGREFKVDFDLTTPVEPPSAPWGYADNNNE